MTHSKHPLSPDELLKEGLGQYESPYTPGSWEHMKAMLDAQERTAPVVIVPGNENETKTQIISNMISITIVAAVAWLAPSNTDKKNVALNEPKALIENYSGGVKPGEPAPVAGGTFRDDMGAGNEALSHKAKMLGGNSNAMPMLYPTFPNKFSRPTFKMPNFFPNFDYLRGFGLDQMAMNETENVFEAEERRLKFKNLKPFEFKNDGGIGDFWFGFYFTHQKPHKDWVTDSANQYGFNIQFMSGNRSHSKYSAAYYGFDWGMQFYERGRNHNVVLNNTAQDSGYTRLGMSSMDLLARGHWEFTKFRIKPYITAFAGPRLYFATQTTASYLELKSTESQTSHNAHTSASMLVGGGLGLRARLGKVISLDARAEMMTGTSTRIVDIPASDFNGLEYRLSMKTMNPNYVQYKIGIIVDVSDQYEEDEKEEFEPLNNQPVVNMDSIYTDPKDSTVKYKYLPCPCCPDQVYRQRENSEGGFIFSPTPNQRSMGVGAGKGRKSSGAGWSPSVGSGGGKGSFPGIGGSGGGGGGMPTIKR